MNKKLAACLTELGMKVEGNNAYGIVNGYEISALYTMFDYAAPVKLHIAFFATDEQKAAIEAAMSSNGIRGAKNATRYGLYWGFTDMTYGKLSKNLPSMLDRVLDIIGKCGGHGFGRCPVCGHVTEGENVKQCKIDGFTVTIEESCVQNLNAQLQEQNAQFDNAPNNYLRGFLGALVGGIVGGGLAALVYLAGFIASISAVVSAILGAFLYQKFGGKPTKMMIVIVSLTTLVCMLLSLFIIYLVEASSLYSFLSATEALSLAFENSKFADAFYTDLAMVFVFSVVGIGAVIFYMYKKVKRKKDIEQ